MLGKKWSQRKICRSINSSAWHSILCRQALISCLQSPMDMARRRIQKEHCWKVEWLKSKMGWYSVSQQLISLSPDLKRLRDEGYNLEIRGGHLLVKDVPY